MKFTVHVLAASFQPVAHIPTMSYTLPTLPYSALPRVIITVDNLQTPVKFMVHVLAASFQYIP